MEGAHPIGSVVGRYALYQPIAAGGTATVHLGRLLGPIGFSRIVAIKRLHAQYAADPDFVSMFVDEARLAARIRDPNVVPTLDVVTTGSELFLVMEYVAGESLARLWQAVRPKRELFPLEILSAVMTDVLHGLHAVHEAKDERGVPLGIVHRDVSPQNVLVGVDGVARVLDFGVAKAAGRVQTTREGQVKGKLAYMPPEQLRGEVVDRRADIYAAGVVLWQLVTGQRLFAGDNEGAVITKVLASNVEAPSEVLLRSSSPETTFSDETLRMLDVLDATILRAVAPNRSDRFATAREMAAEIEANIPPATRSAVAEWVENIATEVLRERASVVGEIERSASNMSAVTSGDVVESLLIPTHDEGTAALTMPLSSVPPLDRSMGAVTSPMLASAAPPPHVTEPRKGRLRTIVPWVVVVILAAILLGRTFSETRSREKDTARDTPSPDAAAIPATSPLPTEPLPPPTTASANEMDAGVVSTRHAPGPSTAKAQKPSKPITTADAPQKNVAAECAPPYWFDEHQVKHYKPQCLDK